MGYFLAGLVILGICFLFKAIWRVIFAPIFKWVGELIQGLFKNQGMSESGSRAMLSVSIIVAIILLILFA